MRRPAGFKDGAGAERDGLHETRPAGKTPVKRQERMRSLPGSNSEVPSTLRTVTG
jgi:hypothetical protein